MERKIIWIKAANKAVSKFPKNVQYKIAGALTMAASGQNADITKPMKGLGAGIFEIRITYRTDAYRAVYAVQLGDDIYVIHAFQKKSTQGIKTPKKEIDLIKSRLKALKEDLI